MSLKAFFAQHWLLTRKEPTYNNNSRMQRPRDVKRKSKTGGAKSRLTPWRKSAPSNLFVNSGDEQQCRLTKSRLSTDPFVVFDNDQYNEMPVDCYGLITPKKSRPLTTDFDLNHKAKSHFNLVEATIDLDKEQQRKFSETCSSSSAGSMPKTKSKVIKSDSGYDTNSYNSPKSISKETSNNRFAYNGYNESNTDEWRKFNSFFKKSERFRSSSCSKANLDEENREIRQRIREQETNLKRMKQELSSSCYYGNHTATDPKSHCRNQCRDKAAEEEEEEHIYELDELTASEAESSKCYRYYHDIATGTTTNSDQHRKTDNSQQRHQQYKTVIAVDIGTTHSGYAYSFVNGKDIVYMMRKPDGGDPGVFNQKCPTALLLMSDGKFHSFGYQARDYYHDLKPEHARRYMYFENFKMSIQNSNLDKQTKITAANGAFWPLLDILSHCLNYFKTLALAEIDDFLGSHVDESSVLWVLTVPAIWKHEAKQLMRLAAEKAGICGKVLIALEPEAASLFCRELKLNEILPNVSPPRPFLSMPSSFRRTYRKQMTEINTETAVHLTPGSVYVVADCGGGTIDITVHQVSDDGRSLKELYQASGCPHGSAEIDACFEALLRDIFGGDFVQKCKDKYPASFVDLMVAFESRKRAAHPYKHTQLNVALPFSFIEYHKTQRRQSVEKAIKRYKSKEIGWNCQGMLTLSRKVIDCLFDPTLCAIINCISDVLTAVNDPVTHMFLVGGFAESAILQHKIRETFGKKLKIIIPNEVGAAVLKGAVLYGLHPQRILVRRSKYTYGIGVLHPFDHERHPLEKLVVQNGRKFCKDVFEKFVTVDQCVPYGSELTFAFRPASPRKRQIVIHMYSTAVENPKFVTDPDVRKCVTLKLDLTKPLIQDDIKNDGDFLRESSGESEIRISFKFDESEIRISASDTNTGVTVERRVDFECNEM